MTALAIIASHWNGDGTIKDRVIDEVLEMLIRAGARVYRHESITLSQWARMLEVKDKVDGFELFRVMQLLSVAQLVNKRSIDQNCGNEIALSLTQTRACIELSR